MSKRSDSTGQDRNEGMGHNGAPDQNEPKDTDRVVERTGAPSDDTIETGFDVEGFRASLVGQKPDGDAESAEPSDASTD